MSNILKGGGLGLIVGALIGQGWEVLFPGAIAIAGAAVGGVLGGLFGPSLSGRSWWDEYPWHR